MNTKSRMPIHEFSLLTGISRDSLRFYDKIGLLCPESRGKNNYRYYTEHQIDLAFLISDLRALGIGLEEIKEYAKERSPERIVSFFSEQEARIETEIERLRSIQELMRLRSGMVTKALQYGEDAVVLEEKEREPVFLCHIADCGGSEEDRIAKHYDFAAAHGVNVSFPLGGILEQKSLKPGKERSPSMYYFKVCKNHNAWKSVGTYAVLYRRMEEEFEEGFYEPLLTFIKENGFRMEGNAYGEYPLDELSIREGEVYKARVEIRVVKNSKLDCCKIGLFCGSPIH